MANEWHTCSVNMNHLLRFDEWKKFNIAINFTFEHGLQRSY
jgi:hypothetical protein